MSTPDSTFKRAEDDEYKCKNCGRSLKDHEPTDLICPPLVNEKIDPANSIRYDYEGGEFKMNQKQSKIMNEIASGLGEARAKALEKYHECLFKAACCAMQGFLQNPEYQNTNEDKIAEYATYQAKALLGALGITKPE